MDHQNSNTLGIDVNRLELLKNANSKIGLSDAKIKNIVFVYTPPKVGSTTLVSSIRLSASYKFSVIHLHDEEMLYVLTGVSNITINEIGQRFLNWTGLTPFLYIHFEKCS